MSPLHPTLTLDALEGPDAYVIRAEGELGLPECRYLESALAAAERSQAGRIVLDLDGLSFIDVRGLRTLIGVSRRSVNNGDRLRLTRGTGEVARLFELTMLDLTLPFTDPEPPERIGR